MILIPMLSVYYPNSRINGKMMARKEGQDRGSRSLWYRSWSDERVWSMAPQRVIRSSCEHFESSIHKRYTLSEGVA